MLDQLKIGKKYSFDDFGASMAKREIKPPMKKSIKETVPFSNVAYDFSAINGEVYWEERELIYTFEIIADNPADLERKKAAFSNWIMNVMGEEIFDPYEPEFHYVGTFEGMDYSDEDCVEKTTATVTFSAYPYKVANNESVYAFIIPANAGLAVNVSNASGHKITPEVTCTYGVTIKKGGTNYDFPAGTAKDSVFALAMGENTLFIENSENAVCTVKIAFYREVL